MSTPLLDISHLVLRFGGVTALQDVSFSVQESALNAIIGPNGAGKTSLLNCVSGVYHPQQGRIVFDGQDVTRLGPAARTRLGVARTFQNIALFRGMTVLDNLLIGRHVHQKTGTIAGGVYWGAGGRKRSASGSGWRRSSTSSRSSPGASRSCTRSRMACRSAWSWGAPSRSIPACCSSTSRWPA